MFKTSLNAIRYSSCIFKKIPIQKNYCKSVSDIIKVSKNEGIKTILMNNMKTRNALSLEMLERLEDVLLEEDQSTKVIVIRSSWPKVFSAGHDLKELNQKSDELHENVFRKCTQVMKLVQDIEVPVIAEVSGLATAAGCQLVASCDIAIASQNARFATPGVNIGLFCHTPGVAVARAVNRKAAMLMLFTGFPISANEALSNGLISKIVEEESLEKETLIIAEKIAGNSRPTNVLGKRAFYQQVSMNRDQAYGLAESKMLENLKLDDANEGISAFLEKRKPTWRP